MRNSDLLSAGIAALCGGIAFSVLNFKHTDLFHRSLSTREFIISVLVFMSVYMPVRIGFYRYLRKGNSRLRMRLGLAVFLGLVVLNIGFAYWKGKLHHKRECASAVNEWCRLCAENPQKALEAYLWIIELTHCEINDRGAEGKTVLHCAASTGNETLVKFLLKKGANPHLKDKHGLTPLDYASNERIVTLMLHANSDKKLESRDVGNRNIGNSSGKIGYKKNSEKVKGLKSEYAVDICGDLCTKKPLEDFSECFGRCMRLLSPPSAEKRNKRR